MSEAFKALLKLKIFAEEHDGKEVGFVVQTLNSTHYFKYLSSR